MDFEEFKYLIQRITILSDRVAGLKTQNNLLIKRNNVLENENERLSIHLTEVNHISNTVQTECVELKKEVDYLRGGFERCRQNFNINVGDGEDNG